MRLLLFFLFPALELYLLVKVGSRIGALNMVLWVFVSALIGIWAVRAQGQSAMIKTREELNAGRVPQTPFLDGVLLFLAGILLLLPGLITDAVGLLLLFPPIRHLAALRLAAYFTARQASGGGTKIFFFSSNGFPGAGQGFSHTPYSRPSVHDAGYYTREEEHTGPRQATIIESTAIEINKSPDPAGESKDSDPPHGNASCNTPDKD